MSADREHWESAWSDRAPTEVGWYQAEAACSLELITELAPTMSTPIIDIGSGASVLVASLLDAGARDLTVIDISARALDHARRRLGSKAADVTWIEDDVLRHHFERRFGVWHDRAMFHFLREPPDRARYTESARSAVVDGGHLVIATFTPDAPPTCSGLPVERYDPDRLAEAFADAFEPVRFVTEEHRTPGGVDQQYVYGVFRRSSP